MPSMVFKLIPQYDLMVVVHAKRSPTEEEWNGFLAAMHESRNASGRTPATLVWSDGGGPNAQQRKLSTALIGEVPPRVALVASGSFMLGVATALAWFRLNIRVFAPGAPLEQILAHLEKPRAAKQNVFLVLQELRKQISWRSVRLQAALSAERVANLTEHAEAVLNPGGAVAHASDDAKSTGAREALRRAAIALDGARGTVRRKAPEEAVEIWKGLTDGGWSLVDRFDSEGRRFILALRNDPLIQEPRALSDRERQVAAFAALGHSLKLIGYELGLSAKTVSFHLRHALNKLTLRSRIELPGVFVPMVGQDK